MKSPIARSGAPLRAALLGGASVVALLGLGAGTASAAYTASVESDTLVVRGNGDADTLVLSPSG